MSLCLNLLIVAFCMYKEAMQVWIPNCRNIRIELGDRPIPNKGVAYIYKKGTNFAELIDTVRFYALARGITDSTILTCILNSKRLNYLNDISVVLDDTLKYDISDIKLSMFVDNEHWTMGGPWEYCIVSSLTANGHVVHDTVYSGSLAFPQRYVRIVKK